MAQSLDELELEYRESDAPDRLQIDFTITDEEENVAWVWGDAKEVEWECNHPRVEYDDDETVGECLVCGAVCDWHYEPYVDGDIVGAERRPHEWYRPDHVGGAIADIINELKKEN